MQKKSMLRVCNIVQEVYIIIMKKNEKTLNMPLSFCANKIW